MDLVVLCGLQASGKSTFRAARWPQYVVVSKDLMRNNRRRERRQRALVDEALAAGRDVVVDNTNPAPDDRAALVEIGRRRGARVVCYYFESSVAACAARNARRPAAEVVPDVGLYATVRRLVPPSPSEGFDEIWRVRITGSAEFEVAPVATWTADG